MTPLDADTTRAGERDSVQSSLVYGIDERPASWWETVLYGWQHTLVDISPFVLPLAVASAIGMSAGDTIRFINFCLFSMGVATLLQTTVGNRLPIIQGPSATLTGVLAPVAARLGPGAMWGAAFAGGLIEMAVGASRLLSAVRRVFPPAVAGVVILTIALALGRLAVRLTVGGGEAMNFALAAAVIGSVGFLHTRCRFAWGGLLTRAAIFFTIWTLGLGAGSLLGRVDWALVAGRPWLAPPRLFPFGGPGFGWEFAPAAILAVLAGYFGSIIESIGDYAATCTVAGETYTARHMNRGIFAEGLGSALATAMGGLPCTSYTQNIGIIAATRVASRTVVRVAACVLLLYGLSPKFGALLVAMPRSVLGGVFVLVCGMIAVSGMRLLKMAPDTPANRFVVGTTLIVSVGVPTYVSFTLGASWLEALPPLVALVLTNPVVLAVLLGVILNLLLDSAAGEAEGTA
ncbi:MAG: uracil-xanthine permease family protein [Gemmatimonadota bacterium]